MGEKKNAQTKISQEKYNQLKKAADKDGAESISEFLRRLIYDAIGHQEDNIKKDLARDIATMSRGWAEYSTDYEGLGTILHNNWEYIFTGETNHIREKVEEANEVHVIGQGTSYTLANYLANQLRNKGIKAQGYKAEEMLFNIVDYSGVLIAISRSGETESVFEVSDKAAAEGMYVIANTSKNSSLSDKADKIIPVPSIEEATKAYTTKAACIQMLVLQEIFLEGDVSQKNAMDRVGNIEDFLAKHFDTKEPEESGTNFRLSSDSPFRTVSKELIEKQDLRLNPIFATMGRYYPLAFEFAHKMSEYLHRFSDRDSLDHIRDHYMNILFNESGYLVLLVPPEDSQEYKRCRAYISGHNSSIDSLLKESKHPKPLRLISITMNENGRFEDIWKNRSQYDNPLIALESFDRLSNDLIMFISSFLFTYAILSESWGSDPHIRHNVPRSLEKTLGFDDT